MRPWAAAADRLRLGGRRGPVPLRLEDLADARSYPVLDSVALTHLLGVGARFSAVRRYAALDVRGFERLYLPALDRFLEAAQLQPASATDHHCGLGGLVSHTLEVVELAMAERGRSQLPVNDPDRIAREAHVWTYAVFVGALLHDAGKLLTLTRLVPNGVDNYSPMGRPLLELGADRYAIELVGGSYPLQKRVSVALLSLIPPDGLTLISRNQRALAELTGWLTDNPYEWGALGRIVGLADRESVRRDLQPGRTRQPLPTVLERPLSERIMQAIQSDLVELGMPLNRNGGAGWLKDGRLWLVVGVAMERARERLVDAGATGIPHDAERMVKELFNHGYLIPSPEHHPMWSTVVSGDDYEHPLTMLCFEASRALHPSRRVAEFEGRIEPVSRAELLARRKTKNAEAVSDGTPAQSPEDVELVPADPPPAAASSDALSSTSATSPLSEAAEGSSSADATAPSTETPAPTPATTAVDASASPMPAPAPSPVAVEVAEAVARRPPGPAHAAAAINSLARRGHQSIRSDPVGLGDPGIGRYFLTWVRDGLESGDLPINQSRAPVHVLEEGVGLVHPALIRLFLNSTGLEPSEDKKVIQPHSDFLRKRLKKDRLLIPTAAKYDFHQVIMPTRPGLTIAKMHCLLVPTWSIFDDDWTPDPNPALKLRQGHYKPNDPPTAYDTVR